MANLNDLERRLRRVEEKLGVVNEYPYTFEYILDGVDKRTLMEIFREAGSFWIARALIGLNQDQVSKIKAALSKNRWNEITQEIKFLQNEEITESNIKGQREVILEKIQELEDMGEIVVSRGEGKEYVLFDAKEEPKEPPFDVQSWLHSTFEKV